jgi:hypothetical protein
MKHVYPPRHPASLDAPAQGPATAAGGHAAEPAPEPEPEESGRGAAASRQQETGRPARRDATPVGEDIDRRRVARAVRDDEGSSHRGPDAPAR